MKVCVELFAAVLRSPCLLRYAVSQQELTAGDPDMLARNLLKQRLEQQPFCRMESLERCILHSTSWRYERSGMIVLTYMGYCDTAVFAQENWTELDLRLPEPPHDSTPQRPRPSRIDEAQVAAHGMRHLAYLIRRNSAMRDLLGPESLAAFQLLDEVLAGRI